MHLGARGTQIGVVALAALLTICLGAPAALAAVAPSVTTGAVTAAEPTSAVATGSVDPRGSSTSYYFEYGPTTGSGYPSKTAAVNVGDGDADVHVSTRLTGLTPATSYQYRLVALSSGGTAYGASGIFNTTAPPTATTVAATGISASGATLRAIVDPDGLSTSWYFEYGLTTSYGSKTATETLGAGPSDENVKVAIGGLTPKTTYHYRVVATSSAGRVDGHDLTLSTGQSVTLNAASSSVTYGGPVMLSGAVTSGKPNVAVTISAEVFDQSGFTPIASVVTGAGGSWNYLATPIARTSYEATAAGGTSSPATIGVRPAVYLVRLSNGNLSTHVVAATSFAGHVLQLQRLESGLWVTWKTVRLNGSAKASFSTRLPRGNTLVRMAIGPFVQGIDQAAPGYLAGFSRSLVYHTGS